MLIVHSAIVIPGKRSLQSSPQLNLPKWQAKMKRNDDISISLNNQGSSSLQQSPWHNRIFPRRQVSNNRYFCLGFLILLWNL